MQKLNLIIPIQLEVLGLTERIKNVDKITEIIIFRILMPIWNHRKVEQWNIINS